MAKSRKIKGGRIIWNASIFLGTVVSIWSVAAILSGLAHTNWQVSEFLRQYLIAAGLLKEFHTLSDFYTHIKGVEYIIVVLFLAAFPSFYSYINKPNTSGAI